MWVQCPQRSEEGVGVTGVSEPPYVDVGDSILVFWKSSKCFNLLSHLSSSCPWYFILPIQQICLMHKILIESRYKNFLEITWFSIKKCFRVFYLPLNLHFACGIYWYVKSTACVFISCVCVFLFHVCVCFAHVFVFVPCALETRKGCHTSWNWNYRQLPPGMWVLRTKPVSSPRNVLFGSLERSSGEARCGGL